MTAIPSDVAHVGARLEKQLSRQHSSVKRREAVWMTTVWPPP
jgi:hypothetical protein